MGCYPVFWRKKNSRSQVVQLDQGKLLLPTDSCSSLLKHLRAFTVVVVRLILFADIPIAGNVKIYSSKELRKATGNFCPGSKLGQGSFGRVYLVGCSITSDAA
jgi:hypothetical protein